MYKTNVRFDEKFEEFEKGLYFGNPNTGKVTDLNKVRILNIAIDTIRQLYKGTIDRLILRSLETLSLDGGIIIEKDYVNQSDDIPYRHLTIPCDLKVTKMGKIAGYRYKLQNNEVGIVILIGSYYAKNDKEFSHLKIELSPHFIAQRTPEQIQDYLDNISKMFLENPEPCGVAPHLAVDTQGWKIPLYMQENIKTRSRAIKTYTGIGELKFNGLQEVIASYNQAETILIGRANSLQVTVYRKDLEIVKSDKVDYFHELWDEYTLGHFNKEKEVVRIEARFHHSIINEFSRGIDKELTTFLAVNEHLNDLWKYALKTIRYEKKGVIMPIWQLLMEDIRFNKNDIMTNFKRQQKTKSDTTAIGRNIGIFIGNYLTIAVRAGRKFSDIQQEIQSLSIMTEIRKYLLEKRHDEGMFFESLKQKYLERCLISKYSLTV